MPRRKGDGLGKTGGRQKGTPNKATQQMRELLSNFCDETFEEFKRSFHTIDKPELKCRIWLDAQAFVTPKLSSVTVKDKTPVRTYQDELDDLSKEG